MVRGSTDRLVIYLGRYVVSHTWKLHAGLCTRETISILFGELESFSPPFNHLTGGLNLKLDADMRSFDPAERDTILQSRRRGFAQACLVNLPAEVFRQMICATRILSYLEEYVVLPVSASPTDLLQGCDMFPI